MSPLLDQGVGIVYTWYNYIIAIVIVILLCIRRQTGMCISLVFIVCVGSEDMISVSDIAKSF